MTARMEEKLEGAPGAAETCAAVVRAELNRRRGSGPLRIRVGFRRLDQTAKEFGCSRYHLAAVLRGRRKPGPELAARLAAAGIKTAKLRKMGEQWV